MLTMSSIKVLAGNNYVEFIPQVVNDLVIVTAKDVRDNNRYIVAQVAVEKYIW